MSARTLEGEFEAALGAWDAHIDRCTVCLVEGSTLCYEGQYLSNEVGEIREALAASDFQAGIRSPIPTPDRRPTLPGALA